MAERILIGGICEVPFGVQHRNYYLIVGCCGAYPLSYNSMMVLAKGGQFYCQ